MKTTPNDMHEAIRQAHDFGSITWDKATALHAEVQRLYDIAARADDPHLLETDGQAEMIRKLMRHNESFMEMNKTLMEQNISLMHIITGRGGG